MSNNLNRTFYVDFRNNNPHAIEMRLIYDFFLEMGGSSIGFENFLQAFELFQRRLDINKISATILAHFDAKYNITTLFAKDGSIIKYY